MPRFVVHEHWALHHHFDLQLELDGVLKSWAVPRGPPSEPGIRRLAVEVDDYPLDHASFEGEIPEGEYGTGRVTIWDRGDYVLLERTSRKIGFALNGGRLKGDYGLIFMKEERGRR